MKNRKEYLAHFEKYGLPVNAFLCFNVSVSHLLFVKSLFILLGVDEYDGFTINAHIYFVHSTEWRQMICIELIFACFLALVMPLFTSHAIEHDPGVYLGFIAAKTGPSSRTSTKRETQKNAVHRRFSAFTALCQNPIYGFKSHLAHQLRKSRVDRSVEVILAFFCRNRFRLGELCGKIEPYY